MIAYVTTQGSRIVKEGQHLVALKGEDFKHTIFTTKLTQLILFGNCEITRPAMLHLFRKGVDTVFLTKSGRYLGRLELLEPKNVFLRKRQFDLLHNEEFALSFVRSVVSGKLANMATVLMRIKRTRNSGEAGSLSTKIREQMESLKNASTVDQIRGHEGQGTALFYSGFRHGFVNDMGFRKRVRRPPTDPVNSVLSLLYTFLMNRVYAAVRLAQLDPFVGHLHSLEYGRHSLVLDLMEEFRSIVCETLTLSLFNLGILKQDDFRRESPDEDESESKVGGSMDNGEDLPDVTRDPVGQISPVMTDDSIMDLGDQRMETTEERGASSTGLMPVLLTQEALRRVLKSYEQKLTTQFYHPVAERDMTYSDALIYQARQYRRYVEGEIDIYQPLLLK